MTSRNPRTYYALKPEGVYRFLSLHARNEFCAAEGADKLLRCDLDIYCDMQAAWEAPYAPDGSKLADGFKPRKSGSEK